MVQLTLRPSPEWQDVIPDLRACVHPLSTSVLVEAGRIRALLINQDDLAKADAGAEPAIDATDDATLSRRLFLMGVSFVAAGVTAWEGLQDVDGSALVHPAPEQVLRLLEQSPAVYGYFDREYLDQAFKLSAEKNGYAPSPDTAGVSEGGSGALTPAKASSAPKVLTPAP